MDNLLMFIIIATLIVMVPGVDFLLVLKNTILYGKKAGHFTTLGICVALTVWTALAVLGLAVIIAKSMLLFNIIKYAGAAYLVWIGIKSWKSKASGSVDLSPKERKVGEDKYSKNAHTSCFMQGVMTDLLNPKTLIFYLTLMPQFIDMNGNINAQLIMLALILMVIAIIWFVIVIQVLDIIRGWFMKPSVQNVFNKTTAVMLILIGVRIALEEKAV